MQSQPTFRLLDGQLGWQLADSAGRPAGHEPTIRLGAAKDGPLSLNSPDGSVGGLLLPAGMAIDAGGLVYLLGPSQPRIQRFDPQTRRFATLPALGGGGGGDPRRFDLPAAIAIAGNLLYVADQENRTVSTFGLADLTVRHTWKKKWDPIDVTARGDYAYILDRSGRVFRHCARRDRLRLVLPKPSGQSGWTRIAVDTKGLIYLLDPQASRLDIFEANGAGAGDAKEAGEVSGRFPVPPIRLDSRGRFCLPASLAALCGRTPPAVPPTVEQPLSSCGGGGDLLFTLDGEPATVEPAETPGPAPYDRSGTWISQPLDSGIYGCQWHRIELDLASLPEGSAIEIATFANDRTPPREDLSATASDYLWETRYLVAGKAPAKRGGSTAGTIEFLVHSHPGQYLWLRVRLTGDGFGSAAVDAIRAYFPRQSYLEFLPPVFSADDESRWFLERFLSIVQTRWDELQTLTDGIAAYFDPKAVPPGAFLAYLARWLALPLEGTWTEEQKRRLLAAAPQFYRSRGTIASLRAYLRIYQQNLSGVSGPQMALTPYPMLIESFRERSYLTLSAGTAAALNGPSPMFGPGIEGRCQLGVFAEVGAVRMVSTGDPEHDVFRHFAHRFRVVVPAAWVRGPDDLRMLRRAIDAEKPAHTDYDLCLVEARFRVGIQSTVGIDTILGAWPPRAGLGCEDAGDREPAHRLGYDMVLTQAPGEHGTLPLTRETRLGIGTTLS
jgi:phage tail-like protein